MPGAPNTPDHAREVLIADDDTIIGMLLGEMLDAMGHRVCAVVASVAAAIEAASRHNPGLLIVDAQLGDGNGVTAIRGILRDQFVPHILMTGSITTIPMPSPQAVLLEKPFRDVDLAQAIRLALGAAGTR